MVFDDLLQTLFIALPKVLFDWIFVERYLLSEEYYGSLMDS